MKIWKPSKLLSIFAIAITLPLCQSSTTSQAAEDKIETREFSFPTEFSLGGLQIMGNGIKRDESKAVNAGKAQGKRSINLPSDCTLLLELNPRCIENPDLIKNMPTKGINRLKLAYLSMDDTDHSNCDKVLQTLPEFKDLLSLNAERSDVTDKGLSGFKSLSHIKFLSAFGCGITGSIFKETDKLKNMERLDLMFNPLKGENFKYLGALPKLKDIDFNQCHLSDDDLQYLPRCPQLKKLRLSKNTRITNKSLPLIRQQNALEILDVRGTGIDLQGMLSLSNLKLKKIIVGARQYYPNEIAQLKKTFPDAKLDVMGNVVTKEHEIFFAPLK